MRKISLLGAAALLASTAAAGAVTVNWANWGPSTGLNVVSATSGTVATTPGVNVGVASTSPLYFIQGDSTLDPNDYWVEFAPLPYTGGAVSNRPTAFELVALRDDGTVTLNFDRAVTDIYFAYTSWNGNTAQFSAPFSIVSEGRGFWGTGFIAPNATSDGFLGVGEAHGVLKFTGNFNSFSFTHTFEQWHGFTIGFAQVADPDPTPAPAALALFGLGVLALGAARRR